MARRFGALAPEARDGEVLGIGLAVGLLVLSAIWAGAASGGKSAYTPVAVILALAIAWTTSRRDTTSGAPATGATRGRQGPMALLLPVGWGTIAGAIGFLFVVVLVYASTIALVPRDGAQPVEFMDEAYYAVLGRDVSTTGIETIYSPSGLDLPAHSPQTWYHWGELWLAGATISLFKIDPMLARHVVILPLLMLAAVALTGSLARRVSGTGSRSAFALGCLACLFLAPIPVDGNFFTAWGVGLLFGITLYGLGAVVVLLFLNLILARPPLSQSPPRILFYAACVASLVPTHIVIAILAAVGIIAGTFGYAAQRRASTGRLPRAGRSSGLLVSASSFTIVATLIWGAATGHGIGASGLSPAVLPFNDTWRLAVVVVSLASISFLAIPLVFVMVSRRQPYLASALFGTMALLAFGAVAWGARMGDFNMFHLLFGGIAVFATPFAAASIAVLWKRLRPTNRRLALALVVVCTIQIDVGVLTTLIRLQQFGPHDYDPIPVSVLSDVSNLEPNARVAYSCRPFEEVAFWDPRLVSIDAHSGRRVVPMCFEASPFVHMTGGVQSQDAVSPLFRDAPQLEIYPDAQARPTPEAVAAFMKRHGIGYIYVDDGHPNNLVPDAVPISVSGSSQLLRIP
jgi:hypothetical protein